MFKSTCVALLLLVPSVAMAQKNQPPPPPPGSTITLQLPGLNCTTPAGTATFKVLAWSWGASNSGTLVGGSGMGKTNLQDVSVTKSFDGCSSAVLTAITTGAVLKGATLTQVGSDVTKTTTVELRGVLLTSWSLGSSTKEEVPSENLSLNFIEICIRDTASGTSACYDSSAALLQ